ncbi:unnamed protein product, partial [Strongylus vulgaris]
MIISSRYKTDSTLLSNVATADDMQLASVSQKSFESQDGLTQVLPKRAAPPFPTPAPLPILKDHFDVEAASRTVLPNAEVALFADEDVAEQEPADFDRMVLLNYGSTDGRLEDDEEPTSASEWNNQKGILPARKELKFRDLKKADEEAAVVQRILEEVCPPSSVQPRSSSGTADNEAVAVQRILEEVCPSSSLWALPSSGTAKKEADEGPMPLTIVRKRKSYKRKTRGRPKRVEKEQAEYVPTSLQRTGRPRGRPKKNGAISGIKSDRKTIEKKYAMSNERRGRPRRAASMIQDFLELYAKVDLSDLEEVHARATTFVRMLIDEYAAASKEDSRNSPKEEE